MPLPTIAGTAYFRTDQGTISTDADIVLQHANPAKEAVLDASGRVVGTTDTHRAPGITVTAIKTPDLDLARLQRVQTVTVELASGETWVLSNAVLANHLDQQVSDGKLALAFLGTDLDKVA